MSDRPEIGDHVHFVGDEPDVCLPKFVHGHIGTLSLHLADTPPGEQPARYWVAVTSDSQEPHSWHPPCN